MQARAGRVRRLRTWISTWYTALVDYYAAAAIFQQLCRLSDAELARRVLSRATLARQAVETRERARRLR